jgi:hypothetical protein
MGAMCGSPNHALLAINGYQASNLIRVPLIKMLGNLRNPQSMEAVLTQSCRIEKSWGKQLMVPQIIQSSWMTILA